MTITARAQTAASTGGLADTLTSPQTVMADIQPVGPMTFYGSAQVDTPVTHKIITRWLDYVDTNSIITRVTRRNDGSQRTETFRIRRVLEIDGRKRFLSMECELEKTV